MDRFAFTSLAAINEMSLKRQALVNEVANVSTTGFKRSMEATLASVRASGPGFDTRIQPQAVAKDVIDMTSGPIQVTGNAMNIAMTGESVLGVVSADGANVYTRRGELRVTAEGALETTNGYLVRGDGGPITVPPDVTLSFAPDGSVVGTNPVTGETQVLAQLHLREASETPMIRRADGLFTPQANPGGEVPQGEKLPGLIAGALEGSNVNAMAAMVELMDHSRSFEMAMKTIKESKDLDQDSASMMRLG